VVVCVRDGRAHGAMQRHGCTKKKKASSPECNHFSDSPRVLMCRFNGSHAHAHTGGRPASVVRVFLSAVLMESSMRMQDLAGDRLQIGFHGIA
jgi:hypothetical protein